MHENENLSSPYGVTRDIHIIPGILNRSTLKRLLKFSLDRRLSKLCQNFTYYVGIMPYAFQSLLC